MKVYTTVAEAASYLHVCTKTVRQWDRAGKLVCVRTPGGHRRIAVALERLMTGRTFFFVQGEMNGFSSVMILLIVLGFNASHKRCLI